MGFFVLFVLSVVTSKSGNRILKTCISGMILGSLFPNLVKLSGSRDEPSFVGTFFSLCRRDPIFGNTLVMIKMMLEMYDVGTVISVFVAVQCQIDSGYHLAKEHGHGIQICTDMLDPVVFSWTREHLELDPQPLVQGPLPQFPVDPRPPARPHPHPHIPAGNGFMPRPPHGNGFIPRNFQEPVPGFQPNPMGPGFLPNEHLAAYYTQVGIYYIQYGNHYIQYGNHYIQYGNHLRGLIPPPPPNLQPHHGPPIQPPGNAPPIQPPGNALGFVPNYQQPHHPVLFQEAVPNFHAAPHAPAHRPPIQPPEIAQGFMPNYQQPPHHVQPNLQQQPQGNQPFQGDMLPFQEVDLGIDIDMVEIDIDLMEYAGDVNLEGNEGEH